MDALSSGAMFIPGLVIAIVGLLPAAVMTAGAALAGPHSLRWLVLLVAGVAHVATVLLMTAAPIALTAALPASVGAVLLLLGGMIVLVLGIRVTAWRTRGILSLLAGMLAVVLIGIGHHLDATPMLLAMLPLGGGDGTAPVGITVIQLASTAVALLIAWGLTRLGLVRIPANDMVGFGAAVAAVATMLQVALFVLDLVLQLSGYDTALPHIGHEIVLLLTLLGLAAGLVLGLVRKSRRPPNPTPSTHMTYPADQHYPNFTDNVADPTGPTQPAYPDYSGRPNYPNHPHKPTGY